LIQYLDTSLLVAFLTDETKSADVDAWLKMQDQSAMAISGLVITEFSAALSIKIRTRQIEESERAGFSSRFARMTTHTLSVLPVSDAHFKIAAQFAAHHELALRAGDALHLAIADSQGATVCTLDKRLAAAGPQLGVSTQLI